MEFTVDINELQNTIKALSVVAKINTTDPEGRILIKTNEDGTLTFVANNNITAITSDISKVEVTDPGEISIVYTKIKSFVMSFSPWNGKFGAKDFHFKVKNNKLVINVDNTFENGKTSKGTLRLETYPTVMISQPLPFATPTFILNSSILKTAIGKVIYAINPMEIRPNIRGMLLAFDEENISFIGTTGLMLSQYKIKNISEIKEGNYIMKYDFIMALRRVLGEETQIFFEVDERNVKAKFDNICLSGTLIVGSKYPEYKPVFDKFKYSVTINKDIFISNLLPFMDVLVSDDNNRLTLSIKDSVLKLENDYANFICDDVDFKEADFIVDVNGSFLKQTVEAIRDDKLLIKFSDDKGPVIFDSGNFQDQKGVVTPIKRRASN